MPDKEKVADGLRHCLHYSCCLDCPYDGPSCQNDVLDDALVLLKEQGPRVLSLEEVQNDCPDYVYLETKAGWIQCCIKDEGDTAKSVGYFVYGFGEYSIKAWEKYGVTWRCWTVMPTEEQRKMVKWNEK